MATHTSITDLLNLTIRRFYQLFVATGKVMEKRTEE